MGNLYPVDPSGKKMDWTGGRTFNIWSCSLAFSNKSLCKLALCPNCYEIYVNLWTTESGNKRRKTRARGHVESVAKVTGGDKGGECGQHTASDLRTKLVLQTDKKYLASNRRKTESGHNLIAKYCYDCGVEF